MLVPLIPDNNFFLYQNWTSSCEYPKVFIISYATELSNKHWTPCEMSAIDIIKPYVTEVSKLIPNGILEMSTASVIQGYYK